MTDPVVTADGLTFERGNITAHFDCGGLMSPVTGKELSSFRLVSNQPLQEAIASYIQLRESVERRQRAWQSHAAYEGQQATRRSAKGAVLIRELRASLEQCGRRIKALEAPQTWIMRSSPAPLESSEECSSVDGADAASALVDRGLGLEPLFHFQAGPAPRGDGSRGGGSRGGSRGRATNAKGRSRLHCLSRPEVSEPVAFQL